MGRSQETTSKKDKEKKRQKKRKEKEERKEERKTEGKRSFEDMIAYVDEFGQISSTPPDPLQKKSTVKIEDINIGVARREDVEPEQGIRTGSVAFFNDSKGYGFIKDIATQESFFVHQTGLIDAIKENDKVTFEVEMGMKGPNAKDVKLVK